jgi:hypothetical protein
VWLRAFCGRCLWSQLTVYVEFILKQHFFSPDVNNIPLILSALVFGISWGLFLGTVIKKESLQTTAIIGSLLIMSGISGMFSNDIRILIQRSFPSLIQFNPVSRISDELIKVNMLGNYSTLSSTFFCWRPTACSYRYFHSLCKEKKSMNTLYYFIKIAKKNKVMIIVYIAILIVFTTLIVRFL